MTDNSEYQKLINTVRGYYESRPLELRNIRNDKDFFDLVWCDGLFEEINLWTYWQGAGNDYSEVMIVGQDFGSCFEDRVTGFIDDYVKRPQKNSKNVSKHYIQHLIKDDKKNKTDNMLTTLTKEGLGEQYRADIPGNERLFFTNLCLGYRTGDKISGGDMTSYMRHDSIYIRDLISIKKPQVVICLGLETYLSLLTAFEFEKEEIKDICISFWLELDKDGNYRDINCGGYKFRMYGVSHAGSNGAMNRKKNCTFGVEANYTGEELMIKDWKKIGKYLESLDSNY